MARILVAECKQEVSSFNPVLSYYEDFEILKGEEILSYHSSSNSEMGGALKVFADAGIDVIPTYSARAITSGGVLAQESFNRLCDEFKAALQTEDQVNGVYLCLHGAMQAQNENDPEGHFLRLLRGFLGEAIPIVISMDLHGIPTERMLTACNALVAYHTYPHVDFFDTGERAAKLLLRLLKKEIKPVTAMVSIPALVRGDELITETGLFGESIRDAQALQKETILAAGMFIGNPFTDVPDLASYSFVTADNDHTQAKQKALKLAEDFWAQRQHLQAPLVPLDEAVDNAIQMHSLDPNGTVIFSDAADATSSGASGDSNAILCSLIEQGYQGRALIPIVDASAVKKAFKSVFVFSK